MFNSSGQTSIKLLRFFNFSPAETVISSKKLPASVRVNLPDIATPYNSPKLYIKGKDNRFYATNINRLVASPNDIIGDDLRQWLDRTGPWSMVLAPNSLASPDYQMTLYISELLLMLQFSSREIQLFRWMCQ